MWVTLELMMAFEMMMIDVFFMKQEGHSLLTFIT
jgi:hypothetical protein